MAALYDRVSTELGAVYEGQLAAKDQALAAKDETIAELRRRAEVAEAERDRLAAAQAAQDAPGAPEGASAGRGERHRSPPSASSGLLGAGAAGVRRGLRAGRREGAPCASREVRPPAVPCGIDRCPRGRITTPSPEQRAVYLQADGLPGQHRRQKSGVTGLSSALRRRASWRSTSA